MLQTELIELKGGAALGVRVDLPEAPLVLIRARKGFAMCGYLNMEAADRMGEVAVRATGVRTLEDLLQARVANVSARARELGIVEGVTTREALERML